MDHLYKLKIYNFFNNLSTTFSAIKQKKTAPQAHLDLSSGTISQ